MVKDFEDDQLSRIAHKTVTDTGDLVFVFTRKVKSDVAYHQFRLQEKIAALVLNTEG